MRRALPFLLAPLLAACPAGGGTPAAAPSAIVGVEVDVAKIELALQEGALKVVGKPGAIKLNGGKATTVTITIVREPPATPAPAYRVMHIAGGIPIASGFAAIAADGGFAETWLGDGGRPVLPNDEVNLTPQNGLAQAGFPAALRVP